MGAAWRGPKERDLEPVLAMVREVKALGLETCCTLGMLRDGQAEALKAAGLDYYNHNLDTAPEFYGDGDHDARLPGSARHARARARGGHRRCAAAGSSAWANRRAQRAGLIAQLANLDPYPESVPINHLVQVEGTPLHDRLGGAGALDPFDFVRTIAVARITMPKAMVRLSAGRRELGDAVQALCFLAGANSIFYGDKLLTTGNPDVDADRALFARLGLAVDGCAGAPDAPGVPTDLIAGLLRRPRGAGGRRTQADAAHGRLGARARASSSTDASSSAFASNDYLGLANHPDVVAAARDGALRWGVGAGASHLVCGHFAAHAALEAELAAFVRPCRRRAGADVLVGLSREPRDPDRACRTRRRDLRRPPESRVPQRRRRCCRARSSSAIRMATSRRSNGVSRRRRPGAS